MTHYPNSTSRAAGRRYCVTMARVRSVQAGAVDLAAEDSFVARRWTAQDGHLALGEKSDEGDGGSVEE